jgi:dihydrofolate reductase
MAGIRILVAQSLDGYLAAEDGTMPWPRPGAAPDDFPVPIAALVMGRTTYEQVRAEGPWPHAGRRVIVVTSHSMETAPDGVESWLGDLDHLAADLRASGGGDAWVVGGAKAIRAFLDIGAVDHLDLVLMPVLLGSGKASFLRGETGARLSLLTARPLAGGAVRLSYRVG